MRRREFIKSSALALGAGLGASLAPRGLLAFAGDPAPAPDPQVKRVLTMFKCHFDAGFKNTQAAILALYFQTFFPQAIEVADRMRQTGKYRYVWTTGSWLLYEYLEQASPADRRRMESAVERGDIAWHALPFNWQTEMLDRSMISGSIALSKSLDRRFGRTTTGAKMTDVPGHTRGLIAPIAEQGVKFLDIGVNGGSTPADVPLMFLWKAPSGASLVMMYHHDYGGVARIPGSGTAIAIVVRNDNSGPHTPKEIVSIYGSLKKRFPSAEVIPTNMTEIANAAEPFRDRLPIVTKEIGDTWIYGVASDPVKVARYREVSRLRQTWIAQGKLQSGDATDVALLRHVLLEPEHTWGLDVKSWIDFDHYTPNELAAVIHQKNYQKMIFSWNEKREDLLEGVRALPAALRQEASAAIRGLKPKVPQLSGTAGHPAKKAIESAHFLLQIDPETGAIIQFENKQTGRAWASPDHPLALFSYQTLSAEDYSRFFKNYIISKADWVPKDFGKPNIERYGARSQQWLPSMKELRVREDKDGHRLLAALEVSDHNAYESGRASFPRKMYLELYLPNSEAAVHANFYWFGKRATRLPEALWLTFDPPVSDPRGWSMDKSGEQVSPFDVVEAGSRHLHAVQTGLHYTEGGASLAIETLDAPLFAFGGRSPINFSRSEPDLSRGVDCCLFNNAWGTNYIMWFSEDMRFRFVLRA